MKIHIITLALSLVCLVKNCFIVHFVFYGQISDYDFNRFLKVDYPYIFHLNQSIKLPNNQVLNRNLTPIEQSDIKKMQVIYHHGGLYLDNDHLIDQKCIQKYFCNLTQGFYLLNWMDRGLDTWYKSVPISFIYTKSPRNPTIYKILTTYNQSIKETIHFSGPFHAQNFRSQITFVTVNRSCQYHIGVQSWNQNKNPEYNWVNQKWYSQVKQQSEQTQKKKIQKQFFLKMWTSHSVIYPKGFNFSSLGPLNKQFNHIELIDKQNRQFIVRQYSQLPLIKQKLQKIIEYYKINQNELKKFKNKQQDQIKDGRKSHKNKKLFKNIVQSGKYLKENQMFKSFFWVLFIILSLVGSINLHHQINNPSQQQNLPQQDQPSIGILKSHSIIDRLIMKRYFSLFTILFIISAITLVAIYKTPRNFQGQTKSESKKKIQMTNQAQKKLEPYNHQQYKTFINQSFKIKWKMQEQQQAQLMPYNIKLTDMGIDRHIQIGTKYDYLNIHMDKQFQNFKTNLFSLVKKQVISFKKDQNLDKKQQNLKYEQFWNENKIQQAIQNIQSWSSGPKIENNTLTYLWSYLFEKSKSKRIRQMEYYYLNKKYNLNLISQQSPICIVSTGHNIVSSKNYQRYFNSLQQQNYTNYRILLIDDASTDSSSQVIYQYLNSRQLRLKNRLKIIKNKQRLGDLGSMYMTIQQLCQTNDIVVHIDIEDALVGFQALKIINSVYLNKQIWFAHSSSLVEQKDQDNKAKLKLYPQSKPLSINTGNYRIQNQWLTSSIQTYRKFLVGLIPLEQLIQYSIIQQKNELYPRFYVQSAQKFLIYPILQMSGNERVKFIDEPIYYKQSNENKPFCNLELVRYSQYQAKAKKILARLENRNSKPSFSQNFNYDYTQRFLIYYRDYCSLYSRCFTIFNMNENLK